jgi:hypothetical protein
MAQTICSKKKGPDHQSKKIEWKKQSSDKAMRLDFVFCSWGHLLRFVFAWFGATGTSHVPRYSEHFSFC